MSTRYFGDWADWDSMEKGWRGTQWGWEVNAPMVEGMATDQEVLFAGYQSQDYQGSALVLFSRDGKLYEVHGSHCSCYGLEGQWSPEETTWEAIAMRPEFAQPGDSGSYGHGWDYDFTPAGAEALRALVRAAISSPEGIAKAESNRNATNDAGPTPEGTGPATPAGGA